MRNIKIFAVSLALILLCAAFAYRLRPVKFAVKIIPPAPPCAPAVADAMFVTGQIKGSSVVCPDCKFTAADKWKTIYGITGDEVILPTGYIKIVIDAQTVEVSSVARRYCPSCTITWGTDNTYSIVSCLDAGNVVHLPIGNILVGR